MAEITKPCPFCGTPARCEDGEHEQNIKVEQGDFFWCECIMCHAQGPFGDTEAIAVYEWNTARWTQWSYEEPPLHQRNRMTALECALKLIRRECDYEDQEHMIGGRVRDLVDAVLKSEK